jgi:hypothetical protein
MAGVPLAMENSGTIQFYNYLKESIPTEEYTDRRDKVFRYYKDSLRNGYLTPEKPGLRYLPLDFEMDLPIYYLFQIELFLENYVEHDLPFITRLLPKFEIIGQNIGKLAAVPNFNLKIGKILKPSFKDIESTLFELLVANLYLTNGYEKIEFLIESEDSTPDLKVDDFYVECKRKLKEPDYGKEERSSWYAMYELASTYLVENGIQVIFEVYFKNELSLYPPDYLKIKISELLKTQSVSFEDEQIKILLSEPGINAYNLLKDQNYIRVDQPLFKKVLFGKDEPIDGGITSVMRYAYKKGFYKISPEIDYVTAGIWHSLSEIANQKKIIGFKRNFARAVNQLPQNGAGYIHLLYESYYGKEISSAIKQRLIQDLDGFDLMGKSLLGIYLHTYSPKLSDTNPGEFEEDCIYYTIRNKDILKSKFLLDIQ